MQKVARGVFRRDLAGKIGTHLPAGQCYLNTVNNAGFVRCRANVHLNVTVRISVLWAVAIRFKNVSDFCDDIRRNNTVGQRINAAFTVIN